MNIEETILRNLLLNKPYRDIVFPFLDDSYFTENTEKMLFTEISSFMKQYKTAPSREALALIISERGDLGEDAYTEALTKIKIITKTNNTEQNLDWLVDETEKYCQEQAMTNAIMDSLQIIDGRDKKREKSIIPELMRQALGVSFTLSLGHNYKEDSDDRYHHYVNQPDRIPCDLYMINKITGGGVEAGTINVALADTGVGKSIFLCHLAACYMAMGLNVIYFTMEMSERALAKRIDANLMKMSMSYFDKGLKYEAYNEKMEKIKRNCKGDLKLKEYGMGVAHAGHFRQVMDEYELKEGFKADIVIIDYLKICASERYKTGSVPKYELLQYVAEELRNIGKDYNIPVWTAHQTNRDGSDTMNVKKKNTGDSYAIIQTVDLMFVLITSSDLQRSKQIKIKQLKNRYTLETDDEEFKLGLDKDMMRFYNTQEQDELMVASSTANLKGKMEAKQETQKQASGFVFE